MSKKKNRRFPKDNTSQKGTEKMAEDKNVKKTSEEAKAKTSEEKNTEEPKAENDRTKELEAQVAELKDKYLRQVAEFDNYRKRTVKEKAELILNGGEKVMKSLLPLLDDLERAEKNMNKAEDVESLKEGVELIFKKFSKILENNGLKKIDAVGKDFDTDYHEAAAMVPATKDDDKGKVIDCIQTGYTLNGNVIRHAKVAVGQ